MRASTKLHQLSTNLVGQSQPEPQEARVPGYDTYLSRCHSPCKSINRSPMFGCNGSCYAFVLVNSSKIVINFVVINFVVINFVVINFVVINFVVYTHRGTEHGGSRHYGSLTR
eukprot:COSAG01_NODE_8393_length_2802_cov_3.941546_2_plen_112_part_01